MYKYDVVLSFAGEDRGYVEKCANILRALNFSVFYDNYVQDELWGKDLFSYLANIYSNEAKYAIIFVSKYYKEKKWANHEYTYINQRVFSNNSEYLLPVKLDDTELMELPATTGYLSNKTPYEVAVLFAKKLNAKNNIDMMIQELKNNLLGYKITLDDDQVNFFCESESFEATYPLSFLMEMYRLGLLYDCFIAASIVPN